MPVDIGRREFLSALGGATAWPFAAFAQQPPIPVIGLLNSASAQAYAARIAAFRRGLGETGYVEGQNVVIEYQWADGQYDRLPSMAVELVHHQVTAIAAITTPCALAAKTATTTIPIVFEVGGDPVELQLVTSLSRPGGNLTGVGLLNAELGPKRLDLLHEMIPTAATVAVIVNPANPNTEALLKDLQFTAQSLGLKLHALRASSDGDLEATFAALTQLHAGALLIGTDPFFNSRSKQLAAFALQQSIPAIYQYREFVEAGGLMSYGASFTEPLRLAGVYVGRILKGEKPADLPVQQVTKVELIVNLKTAKALGLTVPLPLLGRADEVIE
jgi:putative ABC transport system substrate-binding protein